MTLDAVASARIDEHGRLVVVLGQPACATVRRLVSEELKARSYRGNPHDHVLDRLDVLLGEVVDREAADIGSSSPAAVAASSSSPLGMKCATATAAEAALAMGLSDRRVRQMAMAGHLPGARRSGGGRGAWLIPIDALRHRDAA